MNNYFERDFEIIRDSSILRSDINNFIQNGLLTYSEDTIKQNKENGPLVNKSAHLQIIFADLISACRASGLNDVKMLIILMKLFIELYLIMDNPKKYFIEDKNTVLPFLEILKQKTQRDYKDAYDKFSKTLGGNLDFLTKLLYDILKKKDDSFSLDFPEVSFFQIYFLSFCLNDCYMYSIKEEEVEIFDTRWSLNFSLLSSSSEEERNIWWDLAGYFYGLHKEIGDNYLQLDSIKFRNSRIETNWLKTFGQLEIESQDLVYQKKLIEMQIAFKHQDSSLLLSQTKEKAEEELLAEQKILESLKSNSSWANTIDVDSFFSFSSGNETVFQQYRQEAEYNFRIAAKLLHPDRRGQLINEMDMTKEKEDELNNLYRELMTIRESPSLNPVDMVSGDYFSVNKIKRIVSQAEMMFNMAGVKLPKLKMLIIGETMEKQLKYLKNEYNLLQTELAQIQASVQLLYSDKEINQKDSILDNPELIEVTTKKYEDIIDSIKQEKETLQKELKELFEE